mgnify:CR=1 FL=1
MQLEQLKYLVAVAETQSMTTAGKLMYMSHQNISKSISSLEKELGVSLFTRTSKGVSLTKSGWEIAEYARQILNLQNKIIHAAKQESSSPVEITDNLNILLSTGYSRVVSLLQPIFEKDHPHSDVFAREMEPGAINDILMQNKDYVAEFPLIFTLIESTELPQYQADLQDDYTFLTLDQNPIVILAAKSMAFNTKKQLTLAELNEIPFVFFQESTKRNNFFYNALRKVGFKTTNSRFPGSTTLCTTSLINGDAALFAINALYDSFEKQYQAIPFDVITFTPKIEVNSVILLRKDAPPSAQEFVDFFLYVYH